MIAISGVKFRVKESVQIIEILAQEKSAKLSLNLLSCDFSSPKAKLTLIGILLVIKYVSLFPCEYLKPHKRIVYVWEFLSFVLFDSSATKCM